MTTATSAPLATIMNPRSIVVAGASNNMLKMGAVQANNLLSCGFPSPVYFLHPTERRILGRDAFPAVADLPEVPELALLVTPTAVTPAVLDELGAAGVRHAVIITAGFGEVGGEGASRQRELLDVTARHGIRFVGPNCIGILNAHARLNLTVCPYLDRPGHLGLISQSGTYVAQTMPYLRERGIRYSQAISVGNALSIDAVDCLEYLGDDPETHAIAMYVEGLVRGREFIDAARRVAARKPIVALYAGGSQAGRRAVMSHTASLGGPDTLYDGIFAQAGVLRARTVEEMFDWGHALASMPVPRGRRIAILTHSGGPAASMADTCEKEGLLVPEFSEDLQARLRPHVVATASVGNPVDLTFIVGGEQFVEKIPEILFPADEIDGVVIHGIMDTGFAKMMGENMAHLGTGFDDSFLRMLEFDLTRLLALPGETGKPLVTSSFLRVDHAAQTLRDHDVPQYSSPERAVRAMSALVRYGEIRDRLQNAVALPASVPAPAPFGSLNEYEAKKILAACGVPIPDETLVDSIPAAVAAADRLGYPVVVKGLPAGVAHKTEAGLVHLNLADAAAVEAAARAVLAAYPDAPLLVAQMVRGDRELIVGMTRFPGFGPCVMLGAGGIFAEALGDVVFRCAPLTTDDAAAMLDDLRTRAVFGPWRGLPSVDRSDLARVLTAVADLALSHPEIAEIDLNPLIVTADGRPVAVDALFVTLANS